MKTIPLIVCMKWGTRYGPEYANRLYRMCRRHLKGVPFQFVCFTDSVKGLDKGIDARPLPKFPGVPKHLADKPWRKLSLWQKGLGKDLTGRDALFLDLDVVVTGSLESFFKFQPGKYCVWENPTKKGRGIGNTSVFRFTVGKYPHIYDDFIRDPERIYREQYKIEQEYISGRIGGGEQRFWPEGWCVSFKEELLPAWPLRLWREVPLPRSARIVVFHGKPDPDEAMVGMWPVKAWWKKVYKTVRPVGWIRENWG